MLQHYDEGMMNIHETIYETFLLLPSLVHLITAFLMVLALFQNNLLATFSTLLQNKEIEKSWPSQKKQQFVYVAFYGVFCIGCITNKVN